MGGNRRVIGSAACVPNFPSTRKKSAAPVRAIMSRNATRDGGGNFFPTGWSGTAEQDRRSYLT